MNRLLWLPVLAFCALAACTWPPSLSGPPSVPASAAAPAVRQANGLPVDAPALPSASMPTVSGAPLGGAFGGGLLGR